jgi:hypothetical protein
MPWTPPYALTWEPFPTRARTTGFVLVNGIGHLGGGRHTRVKELDVTSP